MRKLCFYLTFVILISFGRTSADNYYYGSNGQIPLLIDSSKVMIKPALTIQPNEVNALINSISRIESVIISNKPIDNFIVCSLSVVSNYNSFIDSIKSINNIQTAEPYYTSSDSIPMYIGASIVVSFEDYVTQFTIDSINNIYGLSIDYGLEYMDDVYVLKNNDTINTLELSNIYHNISGVKYAHPNFGIRIKTNSYKLFDYYHDYQPHTKKVIGTFNSASVWDFAGLNNYNINVAVLDDGVDTHDDLPLNRITSGFDFYHHDFDYRPGIDRYHGMSCAGIIGATHSISSLDGQNKSSGIISLNPNTDIFPIKIFSDNGVGAEFTQIANAISYAYLFDADVLSCSWGYGTANVDFPVITEAINNAFTLGRNGKGCPIIFSSGNNNNPVNYPGRLDDCLSVGATTLIDERWWYSSYGEDLDVVAPSGDGSLSDPNDVWSLDQMDTLGKNPNQVNNCPSEDNNVNINCQFGGTSASAPIVAGIASLILEKDSNLTSQEVYDIITGSAVSNLDWGSLPTVPYFEYGYGRADAFRAILSISKGDVDNNNIVDISDLLYLADYVNNVGPAPFPSVLLGDCDCTGQTDISDLLYLVDYMFVPGSPAPIIPCFEFGD